MKRFPIMADLKRNPALPRSLPWFVVQDWAKQAKENHDQSLERLAERGGLDPSELWCIAHGKRWRDRAPVEEVDAWLVNLAAETQALSMELPEVLDYFKKIVETDEFAKWKTQWEAKREESRKQLDGKSVPELLAILSETAEKLRSK